MSSALDRRSFLRTSSWLASAAIIAPSVSALAACAGSDLTATSFDPNGVRFDRRSDRSRDGYGELRPSKNCPEISIPPGFHAALLSVWDPSLPQTMDDGNAVPPRFDGMGAFAMGGRMVRLVRNHEIRYSPFDPERRPIAQVDPYYDKLAPAGSTTLEVEVRPDGSAELTRQFVSLRGTLASCAGGVTPWGSWLVCEENVDGIRAGWEKNHGYVFEVPATADGAVAAVPLGAMGRFVHEAVAIDPRTGFAYETEDRPLSGLYRFIPRVPTKLAEGGTLQMLAIKGQPKYDTRVNQVVGRVLEVQWVPVENPDSDAPSIPAEYCFNQGFANDGAVFGRLEGCWYGDGAVYFNSTSGGNAGAGQVWEYTPTSLHGGELALVFESPSRDILDGPDNICVSPRGGLVICEDGAGRNFVRGMARDGRMFDVVANNINDSEWAGACFSPQGRTLFVNMQGDTSRSSPAPAATYAIWGPWESGAL